MFASSEPDEPSFGNAFGGCFTRELIEVAKNSTKYWQQTLETVQENLANREFTCQDGKYVGMNIVFCCED